jgi:hypothetical protein
MFWTCGSSRHIQLCFHSVNIAIVFGDISCYSLLDFRFVKNNVIFMFVDSVTCVVHLYDYSNICLDVRQLCALSIASFIAALPVPPAV